MRADGRVPHRHRAAAVVAIAVLVATVGCTVAPAATRSPTAHGPSPTAPATATPGPTPPASAEPAGIELLSATTPRTAADPAEAVAAASAINGFGFDLYRRFADPGTNVVVSPASIALALAMARLGAVGDAASEMDAVLHGLVAGGDLDPINALDAALAARNGSFRDAEGVDHEIVLRIANAPFAQRDMAIRDTYLEALASGFGAGLRVVDFIGQTEAARTAINAWVADQTQDRIEELLGPTAVSGATRLVLVNAIYLKAAWVMPFAEEATVAAGFTRPDGSRIDVPTMSLVRSLRYAAGSDWKAVELPYVGDALAMTLVVPDDLAAFVGGLTPERFAEVTSALQGQSVALTVPKFGFETKDELSGLLAGLGMPSAFDPGRADFSGITDEVQLYISKVIHQANIDVDEKGTEAAAATAVVMDTTGGPGDVVELHVDRPFLFAIRDLETGAIVFLGQVTDPSAD